MKTSTRVWRLADLLLLLVLVIIPVLTGRVYGAYMDSASRIADSRIALAFFLAYGGFELAFLAWISRCAQQPVLPRTARAFALRIELQVAMQVVTRGALILFVILAFDEITAVPSPGNADLPAHFYWPVCSFLAQLAIVYTISISWWRCLSLKRHGTDFNALFDGSYNDRRITIPARRVCCFDVTTIARVQRCFVAMS